MALFSPYWDHVGRIFHAPRIDPKISPSWPQLGHRFQSWHYFGSPRPSRTLKKEVDASGEENLEIISHKPAMDLPRTAQNLLRTLQDSAENPPRTRRTNRIPRYSPRCDGYEATSFRDKRSTKRPRMKSGAAVLTPWGASIE